MALLFLICINVLHVCNKLSPSLAVALARTVGTEESKLPLWLPGPVEGAGASVESSFSLQIEACNKEAEKIESLINSDSPTLASHVPLSALIISQVQVSSSLPSSAVVGQPPFYSLLLLLSMGLTMNLTMHLLWTCP